MPEFIRDNIVAVLIISAVYYFIGVVICVIVTAHDKSAAVKHKRRVSEKTLILLGVFFSSAAEYLTMKTIRHKTKHKKFMIGLPAIFLLKVFLGAAILYVLIA